MEGILEESLEKIQRLSLLKLPGETLSEIPRESLQRRFYNVEKLQDP